MRNRLFEVRHFAEATSTNDLAREWFLQGGRDGATVIADSQTRGRGRLGRQWCSPPGVNIYLSQIFIGPPDHLAWLPVLGALVVRDAVSTFLAVPLVARIKWPNDIEVLGRKVAGILAESVLGERVGGILGLGINVNMRASQFPPSLRRPAASLRMMSGKEIDRSRALEHLLCTLRRWRTVWRKNPQLLLSEYERHCSTLGRRIEVTLPDGEILRGVASGFENQGHILLVKEDGGLVSVTAGETVVFKDR